MEFLLALQFLTRFPVTIKGMVEEKHLARSMAYYPLVGLLLGLATAAVYYLLSLFLPSRVCDLAAILFPIIVTGNIHGDGLMDTVDGIFSGRPRERILEIMRDSRVGSHGVMAGIFTVLSRLVLLGYMDTEVKLLALVLVPALGRWTHVYGAAVYPYARTGGGVGNFTDLVGRREILWATLSIILAGGLLLLLPGGLLQGLWKSFALVGAAMAGTTLLSRYIAAKIGGMTGDTFGAMSETIEVFSLMAILVISGC